MSHRNETSEFPETKRKLVDAGIALMRARGFNATTVDDICAAAKVTKGAFFHYFKSKDDLATAAVIRFHEIGAKQFADAPFRTLADPLDRVFGLLDFAKESFGGVKGPTKGCLVGMLAQELSVTHPELRSLCQEKFSQVAKDFETDLAEAKVAYAPRAAFDPKRMATLYLSIVQGSFILAKASESNRVVSENIEQFRAWLQTLFGRSGRSTGKRPGKVSVKSRS